jgi:hypothetical protein
MRIPTFPVVSLGITTKDVAMVAKALIGRQKKHLYRLMLFSGSWIRSFSFAI